ncbi:hypothetical protein [Persephonella sp.]
MLGKVSFVIFFSLFIIGLATGEVLDFGYLKLKVIRFYPAKISLYEREPVFIRLDFYIQENKTGLQKEVLLSFLNVKPVDRNLILFHQDRSIHPDELKLRVKNVLYLKKGDTYFPFEVTFNTDRLEGLVEPDVIRALSKKYLIEKKQPVYISQVPDNLPYVGSFKLETHLEDEGGTATLYVRIIGKGFPRVPNYQVVVRNGSAKKTGFDLKEDMGYIESVQKFKIVYMDWLEVLPVEFRYFDPFQEKIITTETKAIKITPQTTEKKISAEKLSEEERIQLYMERFKQLYPEYFHKESFTDRLSAFVSQYRNHIILILLFITAVAVGGGRKILVRYIPPSIKELTELEMENLNDFKKLFRFAYAERGIFDGYLAFMEEIFYRARVIQKNGKLERIIMEDRQIKPSEIIGMFRKIKMEIINSKLKKFSPGKARLIRLYLLIKEFTTAGWILVIILAVTFILQISAEKISDYRGYFYLINLVVVLAGAAGYILLKRPLIKV